MLRESLAGGRVARWDTARDAWVQPAGTYTVAAGTSSRELPLTERVHRDESNGAVTS